MPARPSAASSPIPLYHQVSLILRQRVLDGTYARGSQLPKEDDLASAFDVSRATIRQAVGQLVADGLVTRQQGRGTFVTETAGEELGRVVRGRLDDLVAAGDVRRSTLRAIALEHDVPLPGPIAERLRLADGRGTAVHRTRLTDGEPFAYTLDYLPDDVGRHLTRARLEQRGVLRQLQDAGLVLARAHQTIRAEMADVEVSRALDVPLGYAVLQVERTLWDGEGRPIHLFRSWYRSDRYEYEVTYDRDEGAFGD